METVEVQYYTYPHLFGDRWSVVYIFYTFDEEEGVWMYDGHKRTEQEALKTYPPSKYRWVTLEN